MRTILSGAFLSAGRLFTLLPVLLPVLLLVLLLWPGGPVWAITCDPTDNDRIEASRVIHKVKARIDGLDRDLIDTLTKSTAQLSLYDKQLGSLESKLTDGAQKQAAQLARQQKRTAIARDLMPQRPFCEAVTGLAGVAATQARTRQVTETGMESALDQLAQDPARGPAGRAVDTRARVNALKRWQPQTCANHDRAAFLAGEADCLADADIDPLSLLGPATLESPPVRAAAQAWIDTLIAPPAEDPLPIDALSSAADQRDFLARRARLARRALAWYALLQIKAARSPAVRLGAYANALLPPDLAKGALHRSESLSKDDFYRLIARDYFARPDYFVALQGLTPPNRQLEALRNQAVLLMLDEEAYQQRQTTNMLLAALLAERLDPSSPPGRVPGTAAAPGTTHSAPQNR